MSIDDITKVAESEETEVDIILELKRIIKSQKQQITKLEKQVKELEYYLDNE